MTETTGYFASGWDFAEEHARLRFIEEIHDAATTRHLSNMGLTDGWRCLELGAGAGSIARWLAERVGPAGQVVAADIDTRFLQDLDLSNIEVRRLDIRTTDLENERYDLVHCRALLTHLADPERAGRRMVAALRAGGWLLAEEPDLTTMVAVTRDHPDAETFDSFVRRTNEYQRSKADYDSRFGRSLPLLPDRLGLADCGNEVTSSIVRGGEPRARLYVEGRRRLRDAYFAEGVISPEEYERFARALHDPGFAFLGWLIVAAWGRRS